MRLALAPLVLQGRTPLGGGGGGGAPAPPSVLETHTSTQDGQHSVHTVALTLTAGRDLVVCAFGRPQLSSPFDVVADLDSNTLTELENTGDAGGSANFPFAWVGVLEDIAGSGTLTVDLEKNQSESIVIALEVEAGADWSQAATDIAQHSDENGAGLSAAGSGAGLAIACSAIVRDTSATWDAPYTEHADLTVDAFTATAASARESDGASTVVTYSGVTDKVVGAMVYAPDAVP